jgi:protein PhnA
MPQSTPACPQCGLENTYPDATSYICPDCAFEWPMQADEEAGEASAGDGKTELGPMLLKSEFLKKA